MKKILFIIALLSIVGACTVSNIETPVDGNSYGNGWAEKTSIDLNEPVPTEAANVDYRKFDSCTERFFAGGSNEALAFKDGGLMGQFTLTGHPVLLEEEAPFRETPTFIDGVYLVPDSSHLELIELLIGTPLNMVIDEQFYLKLGFINGKGDLESSAEIVNSELILNAIETGDSVTLNMNIVNQMGHGGYEGSVLPCVIVAK